jgi:hypothetical protein
MALDVLVHDITVKDATGFDARTLMPIRNKVVTFSVGTHGPFNLNYAAADYNAAKVQADMNAEVATLRAIGAVQ